MKYVIIQCVYVRELFQGKDKFKACHIADRSMTMECKVVETIE